MLAKATEEQDVESYEGDNINESFLHGLVSLSVLKEGPVLAKEFLKKYGIVMEVIPHLKNTYLDGAAFMTREGQPMVALTLRHDRIDNFWFVLMHELGHVVQDLELGSFIADDMSLRGSITDDKREREADAFAEKALLREDFVLDRREYVSKEDVLRYAAACSVHPAIVAGRIQYARGNYRLFSNIVGPKEVRRLFDIGA